jgi:hypothetical protein
MIWKTDYTGRFPRRPHWELDELERRCEEIVVPFLKARYVRRRCGFRPTR